MITQKMKIRELSRMFGTGLTIAGFRMLKNSYSGLDPVHIRTGIIRETLKREIDISASFYDTAYYFTSKENWDGMLYIISAIIKAFKWEKERFDCDNRASLVSSLCALFFGVNTCGRVFCERTHIITGKKVPHHANLFVTDSEDLFLYDVDNGRRTMLLRAGKPLVMGKQSYKFTKAFFG